MSARDGKLNGHSSARAEADDPNEPDAIDLQRYMLERLEAIQQAIAFPQDLMALMQEVCAVKEELKALREELRQQKPPVVNVPAPQVKFTVPEPVVRVLPPRVESFEVYRDSTNRVMVKPNYSGKEQDDHG